MQTDESALILSRVWQLYEKTGSVFAIITAFRDNVGGQILDRAANLKRNHSLISDIRDLGYGFNVVDGYWIENAGTPDEAHVKEDSLFVSSSFADESFRANMVDLANKYGQEGVLVKDSEGTNVWGSDGTLLFNVPKFLPNTIADAYTRLRKGKRDRTFVFERIIESPSQVKVMQIKHDREKLTEAEFMRKWVDFTERFGL